jgi:16S rRNA (guanine(966)-N(2))-methyltransferase RsmD
MRIIAGEYRGRTLKSPNDNKTRPTSDRLRETLFNILNPRIDEETRFLDLCAGTGAIGIEAISRGARFSSFVDKSRRACGLIEENLDLLEIPEEKTEIICNSSENFVSRKYENGWDIIFYDPPYKNEYAIVIFEIGNSETALLNKNGVLVVEHHFKNNLPDEVGNIRRWRIVKQGETSLSFYEKE